MCDPYNGASAHAWLFEYYFSNNKKAYLFEQMSCGSAGCNLEIQLYSTLEAAKSDLYRREEKLVEECNAVEIQIDFFRSKQFIYNSDENSLGY